MKFTPAYVNSNGTGYYRGDDGKYYYSNPHDSPEWNYISDSTWASIMRPWEGLGLFTSIIAGALSLTACSAIAVYFIILTPFALAYAAITFAWPYYLGILADDLSQGIFTLADVLVIAMVAFLLVYFIICAWQVLTRKVMRAKRMAIVCVVSMTVLQGFFNTIGHFTLSGFLSALPLALFLSILPVIGIVFCEHLATKDLRNDHRWFLTRLAQCITPFIPKQGLGLAIFGAIACVVSVLTKDIDFPLLGWNTLPVALILLAMGLLDMADKAKARIIFKE